MQQLDQQLQKQDKLQINRKAVSKTLRNIEDIATSLKARETGSNHPFLENTMREFVSTVSKARIATSLGQTNYYLAGKVSGACMNCHRVNR
ncbi:hypothetical protein L0668_20445 [Paraglaciecola aquimarina]|uniref:Cytochrome C n=1 Tax=Paraglaciecola algarum TaxID=3050085 RepID=A0ABS9DDQ4_9ALTE|nr:hypothetical protein [Paraglaciecola sp. G1-23]MCF2950490.1 hypothetical protein [Paraglaciecola sp. G1-23]